MLPRKENLLKSVKFISKHFGVNFFLYIFATLERDKGNKIINN